MGQRPMFEQTFALDIITDSDVGRRHLLHRRKEQRGQRAQ